MTFDRGFRSSDIENYRKNFSNHANTRIYVLPLGQPPKMVNQLAISKKGVWTTFPRRSFFSRLYSKPGARLSHLTLRQLYQIPLYYKIMTITSTTKQKYSFLKVLSYYLSRHLLKLIENVPMTFL